MASDDLTPTEGAILLVLMVETGPVLNTDLRERYGIDVVKKSREKLNARALVRSAPSDRTYVHELDDKGWLRVQDDFDLSSRSTKVVGGALAAVLARLRGDVMGRGGFHSFGEMFSRTFTPTVGSGTRPTRPADELGIRLRNAYDSLAAEPRAWVMLSRLRPFFGDVAREDVDAALHILSRADDVNLVPESNQKAMTDADREAALRIGGQDKHLLAIGV